MFVNTSASSKKIGVYTVPAGGSVTYGTWPGGSKHDGIWYNLECYAHHSKDMFNNRVSLSTVLTQNDLTSINTLIATNDEYNLSSDNCVDFALEIWYNVDDYYSFSTGHPSSPNQLLNSIKTITEHEINRAIPSNTRVGYASNGAFVQVSNSDLSDLIDKLYVDDSEIMSEESHPQQSF